MPPVARCTASRAFRDACWSFFSNTSPSLSLALVAAWNSHLDGVDLDELSPHQREAFLKLAAEMRERAPQLSETDAWAWAEWISAVAWELLRRESSRVPPPGDLPD